eukprot:Gregarina_sp_Poly_1__1782@NODE_1461_length_4084_cov_156_952452_g963_i1_p1_GENE_NODE_1461_length_4084_cov_156_952452_g963_i1NODE_1461_length_4084_cov_156_952452_g963_i1_p1_ORF_typecomplete_len721_score102_50_NODE_1461_length_4084_cov_156_952452_g963_i1702232
MAHQRRMDWLLDDKLIEAVVDQPFETGARHYVSLANPEIRQNGSRSPEPPLLILDPLGQQPTEPQSIEPQSIEPQSTEPQSTEPQSTSQKRLEQVGDAWEKTKQFLRSQWPQRGREEAAKPAEATLGEDRGGAPSSPEDAASAKKMDLPRPKFGEILLQLFPFDSHPKSYCAFGTFRKRTSALNCFAPRGLEVIPSSRKPENRSRSCGPPKEFRSQFTVFSSVGSDSQHNPGAECATQYFVFSAGPKVANLRAWCLCRGHGGQGGFLADWVAFFFARRLLGGLQSALGQSTKGQVFVSSETLSASAGSSSQKGAFKRVQLDQPQDIRDLLRLVHSEVCEDFVSTFGDVSYVAPLTTQETPDIGGSATMKAFGDSGVVIHSGVAVNDHHYVVLSSAGDIPICVASRRRVPSQKRVSGRMEDSKGGRSKGSISCGFVTTVFPNPHTLSQSAEKHRVSAAAARAFQRALENDLKKNSDQISQSGGLPRRVLASQRAKALLDIRNDATEITSPSLERADLKCQDPNILKSPTKRRWIEKAVQESPIGRFGITRGIGFLSAVHLGMVGIPDFVEIPIVMSTSINDRVPSSRGERESRVSSRGLFRSNLLSPKVVVTEDPPTGADTDVEYVGNTSVLLKHFLLVMSSSGLLKFISLQEIVTFIYYQIEHKGVPLENALRLLTKYLRRILLQNKVAPIAAVLLKEEITFLCVPLQVAKISVKEGGLL